MVNVLGAELLFGVTDDGENITIDPVGAFAADRLTAFGNPPESGLRVMVYVAVPPPLTWSELGAAEIVKSRPVPDSDIVCGLLLALSAMLTLAVSDPATFGLNVTVIMH